MKAIGDHIRIGPGFGMSPQTDLRWRIGIALCPNGKMRMPYRGHLVRALAERLHKSLGRGYSATMLFDARRLVLKYPDRNAIPGCVAWSDLRPAIRRVPPRLRPKRNAPLVNPGLIELRRLIQRAILAWDTRWVEQACQHPAALLYTDGTILVLVRIIQPKLRYMQLPEIESSADTVIELRWSDRPVIRCIQKHRGHSGINIKDLRRFILAP